MSSTKMDDGTYWELLRDHDSSAPSSLNRFIREMRRFVRHLGFQCDFLETKNYFLHEAMYVMCVVAQGQNEDFNRSVAAHDQSISNRGGSLCFRYYCKTFLGI